MPTSLTNPKMAPELAERIEVSVTGRKSGGTMSLALRSVLRIGGVIAVISFVAYVVLRIRTTEQELDHDRAILVATIRAHRAVLSENDRVMLTHTERALVHAAGTYEGDLADAATLATLVTRPVVYVRGPLDAFANHDAIEKASMASVKDGLLYCLIDPPKSRTETVLAAKVRVVYTDVASLEKHTENVERLADAYLGQRVLDEAFENRVLAARDVHEVAVLASQLDRVPIDHAKRALKANVLIAVMDEPGDPKSPAELDGERAHDVRVIVVDQQKRAVVVRKRKHVDPSAWSQTSRADYATGLDSCAVAFDVLKD
jgi:hypothetical protein